MTMKSVMAGEYTAPPAQGPMIAEICGHDARGQRVAQEDVGVAAERHHALLDARAARVVEADDRARRCASARSMTLQIFAALVSDSEPPNTVKSCAKT